MKTTKELQKEIEELRKEVEKLNNELALKVHEIYKYINTRKEILTTIKGEDLVKVLKKVTQTEQLK